MFSTLEEWTSARDTLIAQLQQRRAQPNRISRVEQLIQALLTIGNGTDDYDKNGVFLFHDAGRIFVDFKMSQEARAVRMVEALVALNSPFLESVRWTAARGTGCITIVYASKPA